MCAAESICFAFSQFCREESPGCVGGEKWQQTFTSVSCFMQKHVQTSAANDLLQNVKNYKFLLHAHWCDFSDCS